MIRQKSGKEGGGIQLLPNRFCYSFGYADRIADLLLQRRRHLELSLVITLALSILVLQGWKRNEPGEQTVREMRISLSVEEIPQTRQSMRSSAPQRPSIPIASEDEEIPDDETIELTYLSLDDVPVPPPPLSSSDEDFDSIPLFVPHDEPPIPVGGYTAIQKHLVYPELGLRAGIQGTVLLHVLIGDDGSVKHVKVLKELDMKAFSDAAVKAVRSVEWIPAMQRDRAVTVWTSVPIVFKIQEPI